MLFDTHAHYDDEAYDEDRDELLAAMPSRGVSLILNASSDMEGSLKSIALAERYPFLYCAVGVHPHSAGEICESALSELSRLAEHPKVRAVGEIGLDYFYKYFPPEIQKRAFEAQLALARDTGLPAIIHDRDAHADTMEIIKKSRASGVFHCFSGSLEMAKVLLREGWYLSFTGAITFKNAKRAHEVIEYMPLERIMLETDCPYLTPSPHRGKRNDSGYLPLVAECVAAIRGMEAGEIVRITAENGRRLFGIGTEKGGV